MKLILNKRLLVTNSINQACQIQYGVKQGGVEGLTKCLKSFLGWTVSLIFFFKKSKSKKIASCLQVLQIRDGHDQIPLLKYMWSIQQQN